jgi:hypothetical protein
MGINVPARNVIIYESQAWNGSHMVPISVADYKNMAGRAGRYATGDAYGCSYLLAESDAVADAYGANYVLGTVEGFDSSFGTQPIISQVLEIIAGGLAKTPEEVQRFIFSTYNGQHQWTTPQSKAAVTRLIVEALRRCRAAKAIEIDASRALTATPAGRLCAAGGYSVDHLVQANTYLTENTNDIPASVIFWALETDSQCDNRGYHIPRLRTPEFMSGRYQEALRELAVQEALGPCLETLVQGAGRITYDQCVIVRRCLACYAWISAMPLRRINENFPGVTAGAIRNTAEVCAWLIAFLAELARIIEPQSDRYLGLRELCERLSYGATQEALALCSIRDAGLARDERHHLVEVGIRTIDDVLARTPQEIPLPRHKALRLIAAAETTIEDTVERRKRFQCSRLSALGVESTVVEKLYEKGGRELEFAVDDFLKPPFMHLICQRVTQQREGEPDHLLFDAAGNVFAVQTTANEKKNITMAKAVTVIGQSARYRPVGYIVIGRPDFESLAIKNAEEQIQSGRNYKLFPVSTLAEMFVLFHEKKLTSDEIAKILVEWQGYVSVERITEFMKTPKV